MKKKPSFKRIFFSKVTFIILLVLVFFVGYSAVSLFIKRNEAWKKTEVAKKNLETLQQKKVFLETNLQSLETPDGQDEAIKDRYIVTKDNEGVIVITEHPVSQKNETEEKVSFWRRIKNQITSFFKKK